MCQGHIAVIGPQWVRVDVGDDHWLCTVSGRSTRTRERADGHAINCLIVGAWQARRRSMPKTVGAWIHQKDRRQRTACQFFDKSAYSIEDETARITPGYHLEEPVRSEEHTSELQSRFDLVCRLLLEKKKKKITSNDLKDFLMHVLRCVFVYPSLTYTLCLYHDAFPPGAVVLLYRHYIDLRVERSAFT